jgi:hypothetical protein
MPEQNLKTVSDDDLLRGLSEILRTSRWAEADLVARIAEADARKLYAREAAPSMFVYCTQVLHLSEQEAYLRIAVGRATREHPMLLEMLRDGRLHLSGIARLAPHLTRENREALLARATHMSHRQVVELLAALDPKPNAPAMIRKLPTRKADGSGSAIHQSEIDRAETLTPQPSSDGAVAGNTTPRVDSMVDVGAGTASQRDRRPDTVLCARRVGGQRPAIEPVAPARFRVRFDASAEFRDKLERLQALTRSAVPDGDLATVIELAVTRELERLEARRFGKTKKPRKSLAATDTRPRSRHIPAAVRRIVEERDRGRCTYRDRKGRRCRQRHDLEFHHRMPFGLGGEHSPGNLALMCRTHNALIAEADFGKEVMERRRRSARSTPEASAGCAIQPLSGPP